jgi:tetratricopeptide (TPR) repeat protein
MGCRTRHEYHRCGRVGPLLFLLGWSGTSLFCGSCSQLARADAIAEAREAVAKADYDTATSLLTGLIAQLEAGPERAEAKELLGDCHLAAGRWQDAITPLAEAADGNPARAADILPKLIEAQEALPVGVPRLDALWRRGVLEARVTGPEAARATYETALAEHDDALQAFWDVTDVRPYAKARRDADRPLFRASLRRAMARLLAEQGQRDAAVGEWKAALLSCPAYGAEEVSCREVGRLLREERPTEALAYLLRSLSFLGDLASGDTRAALPTNERALKAIGPHTEQFAASVFAGLQTIVGQFPDLDFPDETALGDLVSRWRSAEELSHNQDFVAAFDAWLGIAESHRGTLVANVAHLAAAECAFNAGHYELAAAEFPAAQTEGAVAPAINPLALYGRGHAALAEGRAQVARACFEAVLQAGDVGLQALARLRLAECLEMLGDAPGAEGHLQLLRNQHPDEYLGQMAREGLKRLDEYDLSELRKPADERRALYLGEDRRTRGRWRTYGRDAFILCAANGLADLWRDPVAAPVQSLPRHRRQSVVVDPGRGPASQHALQPVQGIFRGNKLG